MPLAFIPGYFPSELAHYILFKTPNEVCMAEISERGVLSLWHLRVGFHTLGSVFQSHDRHHLSDGFHFLLWLRVIAYISSALMNYSGFS